MLNWSHSLTPYRMSVICEFAQFSKKTIIKYMNCAVSLFDVSPIVGPIRHSLAACASYFLPDPRRHAGHTHPRRLLSAALMTLRKVCGVYSNRKQNQATSVQPPAFLYPPPTSCPIRHLSINGARVFRNASRSENPYICQENYDKRSGAYPLRRSRARLQRVTTSVRRKWAVVEERIA
jgi:hypothetical protein